MHRLAASLVSFALICACSSTSSTGSTADPVVPAGDDQTDPPAATPAPPTTVAPPAPDACGTVPKSMCTPANPGSVVRGIVKFDPAHYAGKTTKPVLRVFMLHQWTLIQGEEKQGGHPHAFGSFPDVDMDKGEVSFTLDLCELGTAMWSEENCGFNIVVMLDENGTNDPYAKGQTAFIPDKGELVKMVPVEVSCHAPSQCLQITADCADGDACTTYTPITSCACAANKCPSDDKYCN